MWVFAFVIFSNGSKSDLMEKAGNFIRFVVIPIALFFTVGMIVAGIIAGGLFMAIGMIKHFRHMNRPTQHELLG